MGYINFRTLSTAYILATFLFQDLVVRGRCLEEAIAYRRAGAWVYTMFVDTDSTFSFLSPGIPSCCGVAHAADLIYTFEVNIPGVTSEADRSVGQYVGEQINAIINTGNCASPQTIFIQIFFINLNVQDVP